MTFRLRSMREFKIPKYLIVLLFSLLLSSTTIQSQTVNTDFANEINAVFAGMDKSKVPHKLLLDYAMEFTELSAYNGVLTDTNYVQQNSYKAIYNTLLMARVQVEPSLVDPTTFKNNWDNQRAAHKIVLSGLYYKYSKLRENALAQNDITVSNNKYYDKYVGGVWQNPYETKQVFAMSSPIVLYKGLTVDVELPSNLWYTNQGAQVQSIAIDFDDGNGYQTMTFGQSKTITYTTAYVYNWTYKLTLTNNQVLYSHSKIIIKESAPTATWSSHKQ